MPRPPDWRLTAGRARVARWRAALEWAPAFLVASLALVGLVIIVAIAIISLPDKPAEVQAQNGQSIVAIGAAAFGVIGATVGAFFGVTSAGHSLNRAAEDRASRRDD